MALPRYFIHHATPAGDSYVYPVPALDLAWHGVDADGRRQEVDVVSVKPVSYAAAAPRYVVAPVALREIVASWDGPPTRGPWRLRKRRPSSDSSAAAILWDTAHATPTPEILAELEDEDDTPWASVYEQELIPGPPQAEHHDVSDFLPLPGHPDPDPDVEWTVSDPTLVAIYGEHTAHLWPGSLGGVRDRVVEALRASELKPTVHHHAPPKVSVYFSIPWDIPMRRAKVSGDRGRGPFFSTVALTIHEEHAVPERLAAKSKVMALGAIDFVVEAQVSRFLPTSSVSAGSACAGKGFHLKND